LKIFVNVWTNLKGGAKYIFAGNFIPLLCAAAILYRRSLVGACVDCRSCRRCRRDSCKP